MGGEQRTLFLHGGPGLSAGIERLWFGDRLPIVWWDQPAVPAGAPDPFGQLVAAATARVRALAEESGAPVALVAHSFGGRIAYALARAVPELVADITLLGCAAEVFPQFFRLFARMTQLHASPALADAIAAAQTHLDLRSFEAMVLVAAAHPAYPAVYFGPGSAAALDRFLALLPQVRFLDAPTFLAVLGGLFDAPALAPAAGFTGEVTLLLGRHDPLLVPEQDIAAWRAAFPRLHARVVDCGHIVHLELPPPAWWPTRPAGY